MSRTSGSCAVNRSTVESVNAKRRRLGGIAVSGRFRGTAGDRVAFLHTLATLEPHPESVPINNLVQVEGTPLAGTPAVDPIDFVRIIAIARILMPRSHVRLSAGRAGMSDEMQALCFLAGANSIFYGDKLLVTGNPDVEADRQLLDKLGLPTSGMLAQG